MARVSALYDSTLLNMKVMGKHWSGIGIQSPDESFDETFSQRSGHASQNLWQLTAIGSLGATRLPCSQEAVCISGVAQLWLQLYIWGKPIKAAEKAEYIVERERSSDIFDELNVVRYWSPIVLHSVQVYMIHNLKIIKRN
jgi:hypothetical protein